VAHEPEVTDLKKSLASVASLTTLKGALVPAVKESPDVRVAVRVTPVSGVDSVTPVTTTWLVPAVIVPVVVPPIVPPPVFESVKPVLAETTAALLLASCD
jgi:hypothetical protein